MTVFFELIAAKFPSRPLGRLPVFRQVALGLILCATVGCRLTSDAGYSSPSYAEQNEAILQVVSYGATREQAVEALLEDGVQGSFGVSESVYYCDVWDRGDGRRWHLDVALFFDQSGRLYKVGRSQPELSALDTSRVSSTHSRDSNDDTARDRRQRSKPLPISRTGRRTPFAEPGDLE